jgi:hypothetical protein
MYRLIRWMDVDLTRPMLTVWLWTAWVLCSGALFTTLVQVKGWRMGSVVAYHPFAVFVYLAMMLIVALAARKNPLELITVNMALGTVTLLLVL